MAEEKETQQIPNWKQEGIKSSLEQFWARTKQGAKDAVEWVKDHPLEIAASVVAGAKILREVNKAMDRADQKASKCRVYDFRRHQTVYLKRPMKNWEVEEYNHRYDCGEDSIDILRDMGIARR